MSTKRIIATINVILALLIRFSTQYHHSQSDTYHIINDWAIETNLLDFDDTNGNEKSMAFNPCLVHYCPKGMECIITTSNMPSCVCQRQCVLYNKRKRRHICGSNGKLYPNYCELYREECLTGSSITISDRTVCNHSEPTCSVDEYIIMKDNLLLFHHQNMAYLQHGLDVQAHRMDYLVSIIFSHYDQNNDGLVEKDELALMWNSTMNMYRVANDSNCTLLDMLVFDDTIDDHVLTINEFNDAFRRISETQTQGNVEVTTFQQDNTPKVHIDTNLIINHLKVRTGDNMEINCDITGVSASLIVWKRFGYNLSQKVNETDDYDDTPESEIKIMSNGGIYIQNVQMKHAGNYSCQASTNRVIIQTHIVRVHTSPLLLVSPEMQSKRPGESADITCYSVGEFFPSLEWLKNEKPLDTLNNKYTIIGNGTSLRINSLSFYDTGAYTCTSTAGHSKVSTLVVQLDPTPISVGRDQKLFIFHSKGISIYSSDLCLLVHEIHALSIVPGTDDTICSQYARLCTWGELVSTADGLIYITQPMMDRILVLSIAQLIVIEIIPTDGTPTELYHIPTHDQLWIVNYNLHRDGTISHDPTKTLQMVPDARMIHVKHHAIQPETISGDILHFYVPPVHSYSYHTYDFKYGFVTHHKKRGFFKLDLSTMRYVKYVDLSIYDCVPEHIKFGGLYGFIIISCMEPVTHRQTGQLVLDYITSSIISIKADLVGVPFISPDSRYVVTINHRHDSVLLSVQQVSINGLMFMFDVETTLNISDIQFSKSSTSLDYDVYATTDKSEILCLSLDTGKVETITGVGEPNLMTWFNGGRKLKESDLFSSLIATPSKDAVFIISTKTKDITCEIDRLENPTEIAWA